MKYLVCCVLAFKKISIKKASTTPGSKSGEHLWLHIGKIVESDVNVVIQSSPPRRQQFGQGQINEANNMRPPFHVVCFVKKKL